LNQWSDLQESCDGHLRDHAVIANCLLSGVAKPRHTVLMPQVRSGEFFVANIAVLYLRN
jgi:hypothetical protein